MHACNVSHTAMQNISITDLERIKCLCQILVVKQVQVQVQACSEMCIEMGIQIQIQRPRKHKGSTIHFIHLGAGCLDNVGSLTSHNPIGLHGLSRG
jgi:hypothetical protein